MHPHRTLYAIGQVVGGVAVLGSYAHGIATHPDTAGRLWGELPEWAVWPYTGCMPFATVGYLLTAWFFWRHLEPDDPWMQRVIGIYALTLGCSTLWMPLCFAALDSGDPSWLPAIQGVLAGTAVGAMALIVALLQVRREPTGWWRAAVVGAVCFAVQTVLLDAIIWPRFFVV